MAQRLRGLVGQSLSAKKRYSTAVLAFKDSSAGDTSYTATAACVAFALAWGGGASGSTPGGVGGGGGAAGLKKIKLSQGAVLSWVAGAAGAGGSATFTGADGGDTTISAPGLAVTAGGGKAGGSGGAGGILTGFWDFAAPGIAQSAGSGGNSGSLVGHLDTAIALSGAGVPLNTGGTAGGSPAGGGCGNNLSGAVAAGGSGRVLVFVFKINAGLGGGAL